MPADHVPGKPRIGTFVDYYNPRLMQRIGLTEGYGKRYDGPYAAIVTNNLGDGLSLMILMPELDRPMYLAAVPHKDKAPTCASQDGTNHPGAAGNGYWDWQNQTQAARAAKELAHGKADNGSTGS